jgi:DnaJ-domain-containing protein 1
MANRPTNMDDWLSVGTYLVFAVGVVWGLFFAGRGFAARFIFAGSELDSWPISDSSHQEAYPVTPARVAKVKAWHEVLEVNADANLAEVKVAYREKIGLYHPDKVAGLGHELRQLAEAHTRAINAAYDIARKRRGTG